MGIPSVEVGDLIYVSPGPLIVVAPVDALFFQLKTDPHATALVEQENSLLGGGLEIKEE